MHNPSESKKTLTHSTLPARRTVHVDVDCVDRGGERLPHLLRKRGDRLLAGICRDLHLAAARLQLDLGLAELLCDGRCAVNLVQDGLARLGSQVGDLHLLVTVVVEAAALHADGLVAGGAVQFERLPRVNLAARGGDDFSTSW
jgi:hypothetical protein